MKKFLLFATMVAMAFAFVSCDDDDCSGIPPASEVSTASITEVQKALNRGVLKITLTQPLTADASFAIPNVFSPNKQLTLDIPAGGNNVAITQENGHGGAFPVLNLNVEDAGDLTIDAPAMVVNFTGSVTGVLTTSTATDRLTIERGSTVETLNVGKGNVYVYGQVHNYGTLAPGVRIVRPAATADELRTMLSGTEPYNGGVVLTANIHYTMPTMSGAQANQNAFVIGTSDYKESETTAFDTALDPYTGYIFDGDGHTIGGAAYNNVMIVFANNAVVKNLKIEQNAAEKAALTAIGRGNNGLTVYRSKGVVIENVTVSNTQKAGVVVSSSVVKAVKLTTGGNAWGGVNVSGGVAPTGIDQPELTFVSGTLNETSATAGTGPFKIWVDLGTLQSPTAYSVTVPAGWTSALTASGTQRYYYPAQ